MASAAMSCHIISIPDTPILQPHSKIHVWKNQQNFGFFHCKKPQSTPLASAWISECAHELTARPLDAVTAEPRAQTDRARQVVGGDGLREARITRRDSGQVGQRVERDGERQSV